jgi:uncharacterized membrane protein
MGAQRLEAFSDGVIAIIITIMVLELKVPEDTTPAALARILPVFFSYVLSFIVVAIMWVNHHHLIHSAKHAHAQLLWANNMLLFWMSLIPFVTGFMGHNPMAALPVAIYGAVLACCGIAFVWLRHIVLQHHSPNSELTAHHSKIRRKNIFSATLYAASAPLAFISVYLSLFIFVLIPVMYFLPERKLAEHS